MIKNRIRGLVLFSINHFWCGNYLWALKRFLLRLVGVQVGSNVKIVGPLKVDVCCNLSIGNNTWVGKNLTIHGNADVSIGDFCDIAPEVILETGTHEIGSHQHRAGNGYCMKISIEDGCWIGVRATVLAGVIVHSGSIIAAGAVVNKDVPSDVLLGGVPGKVIKKLD